MKQKDNIYRRVFAFIGSFNVYYFLLLLTVASLPLSKFTVSISMFALAANWIFSFDFNKKFTKLLSHKEIFFFMAIFFVHVIGIFWSDDVSFALRDLRAKIPLLILPLIIGTSYKISEKQIKIIVFVFGLAVFIGAVLNTFFFFEMFGFTYTDVRKVSTFISHIHFSVFIGFVAIVFTYYATSNRQPLFKYEKIIMWIVSIYSILFLFLIIKTLTGITIFLFLVSLIALIFSFRIKNVFIKIGTWLLMLLIPIILSLYLLNVVNEFYNFDKVSNEDLEVYTINGNPYSHQIKSKEVENGHYVFMYVCNEELRKEWNKVSEINFDSSGQRGERISLTLTRYLTSLGYRKDSVGFSRLLPEDYLMIEKGYANYIFKNKFSLYPRTYLIIWQLDKYFKGADPAGMSIAQRIESYKITYELIKDNFWFGFGTGDVKIEFKKKYIEKFGEFKEGLHIKGTNQFLTFFAIFGVFGFIIIVVGIFYPVYKRRKYIDFLFKIFFLSFIMSLFFQNDLKFQISVTYFAVFYSLFLFGRKEISKH